MKELSLFLPLYLSARLVSNEHSIIEFSIVDPHGINILRIETFNESVKQ